MKTIKEKIFSWFLITAVSVILCDIGYSIYNYKKEVCYSYTFNSNTEEGVAVDSGVSCLTGEFNHAKAHNLISDGIVDRVGKNIAFTRFEILD